MSARGFVDWGLAERVALALGGNGGASAAFDQDALDAACADAVDLVLDYSRLRPAGELPQPELVDRAEWTRIGLRTMRALAELVLWLFVVALLWAVLLWAVLVVLL